MLVSVGGGVFASIVLLVIYVVSLVKASYTPKFSVLFLHFIFGS